MPCTKRAPWLLLTTVLLAACTGGRREPVDVRVTSLSPSPGTVAVSRRVVVRAAFDQAVDPASCTAATCWLERADGGGRAPAVVSYEPGTQVVTLAAEPALAPTTTYRVQLSRDLRTASGAPFATATSWEFTTDNLPAWDPAVDLATGTLLAVRTSRFGSIASGVHVLWADSLGRVQLTRTDGTQTGTMPVGLTHVEEALVADDLSGHTVVIGRNALGGMSSARRAAGEIFQQPLLIESDVQELLDFDLRGDLMVVAYRKIGQTWMRVWRFGQGWLPPVSVPNMLPRVHVAADGTGTAVGGFHRFVPFVESPTWCRRWTIDAFGAITVSDPEPATPNAFVRASDAVFTEDGRIVAAMTVDTTTSSNFTTVTRLFEYQPGAGWEQLPALLGEDPKANAIAVGPGLSTSLVTVAPGLRPVAWTRAKGFFLPSFLGSEAEPAPTSPAASIVVTGMAAEACLWTAASATTPDAPVRLLGATRLPYTGWSAPMVVSGPRAATAAAGRLHTVAVGIDQAVAVWAEDQTIRTARLH